MWFLRVIMTILGVPSQDKALMLKLSQQHSSSQSPELAGTKNDAGGSTGMAAIKQMFDYF